MLLWERSESSASFIEMELRVYAVSNKTSWRLRSDETAVRTYHHVLPPFLGMGSFRLFDDSFMAALWSFFNIPARPRLFTYQEDLCMTRTHRSPADGNYHKSCPTFQAVDVCGVNMNLKTVHTDNICHDMQRVYGV